MRLLTLLFILAATTLPARAVEVTDFTLDNGLQVVVLEDKRAPVVVHMLWYRAGAADEPPGGSGVAHFLEHLLFKATEELESGEFSEIVTQNGGSDNAFTSQDATAYFQRVASDRLELMMQMEADRMRNIRLIEEDILTERNVILEERAQRTDSNPNALFSEQRTGALYLNHPYGIPVIGWRHEMEKLGMDDVMGFYETFYAPNNAILIVAGDADPDEVRVLAEKHYGPLEPTPGLGPRERPSEPPQLAERRLLFEDPRISDPYVARSYLAPERNPGDQEQAAALVLLSELLNGNEFTAVLPRKLVFEEQKALYTWAFYDAVSYDASTFGMGIVPAPGVTLEEAEAALDEALAEFIEEGVDVAQFERVKFQLNAARVYAEDSVEGLARRYGNALTSGLTIEDVEAWPDILQAVTPDQVIEAAKLVLNSNNSVTGWARAPIPAEGVTQ